MWPFVVMYFLWVSVLQYKKDLASQGHSKNQWQGNYHLNT